jgi:hypothetical protein
MLPLGSDANDWSGFDERRAACKLGWSLAATGNSIGGGTFGSKTSPFSACLRPTAGGPWG